MINIKVTVVQQNRQQCDILQFFLFDVFSLRCMVEYLYDICPLSF